MGVLGYITYFLNTLPAKKRVGDDFLTGKLAVSVPGGNSLDV
jgi:hypothetical protein